MIGASTNAHPAIPRLGRYPSLSDCETAQDTGRFSWTVAAMLGVLLIGAAAYTRLCRSSERQPARYEFLRNLGHPFTE